MLEIFDVTLPALTGDRPRRCYVYLPKMYHQQPHRRFPVLYMFDGHNVFLDDHATYGTAWRLGDWLDKTKTPLIVVAVECNHEGNGRLSEYSPFDFSDPHFGEVEGLGQVYMDWLVQELKPTVDAHLRTLPDAGHTAIAGSSMGGLMALYAGVAYNRVFHKAACLSPSLWTAPEKLLEMVRRTRLSPATRIYMDYGEKELGNHDKNTGMLAAMAAALVQKRVGLTFRIVPGGSHCEASWSKQIPVFMQSLGL